MPHTGSTIFRKALLWEGGENHCSMKTVRLEIALNVFYIAIDLRFPRQSLRGEETNGKDFAEYKLEKELQNFCTS